LAHAALRQANVEVGACLERRKLPAVGILQDDALDRVAAGVHLRDAKRQVMKRRERQLMPPA
jgi:hypothetical protein